jgi:hypothetical protein
MIRSITLTRRARFAVLSCTGSTDTQCGNVGTRDFTYTVEITCHPSRLDLRGFIIDSLEVKRYFEETFGMLHDFPSCETMAMRAARDLGNRADADRCVVTIGTDALAGLTAVWEPLRAGEVLPTGHEG